jgi:putative resolvase
MEIVLTIAKAAELLGVTVKTLQRWDREGRLKPVSRTQTKRRVYTLAQLRAFQGLDVEGHPLAREPQGE